MAAKKKTVKTKGPAKRIAAPKRKPDRLLKKLEKDIVKNQGKMTEAQFQEEERKVLQDRRQSAEGMGIEEEEDAGQEPYPEIEEALKDPEEEEDEDKL